MAVDISCLVSTIRNVAGSKRKISIVPPHGAELDNNEEVSISGHVVDTIGRIFGARGVQKFFEALEAGWLELVSTPAPILYDATLDQSQMLVLNNNTLAVAAPCWLTSLTDSEMEYRV